MMARLFYIRIYLFFILIFYASLSSADDNVLIDSLTNIIHSRGVSNIDKAQAYVELSEILYMQNPDTVIPLCKKAYTLSEKYISSNHSENNPEIRRMQSDALNNIGYIFKIKGQVDSALFYYQKSLNLSKEIHDSLRIARTLNNIGMIYHNKGILSKALDYYFHSLKIKEALKDTNSIAVTLNNIGLIYMSKNDIDKALDYFQRSLTLKTKLHDKHSIAILSSNIGFIYKKKEQYDKALEYYLSGLKIYEELQDKKNIALSYNNIGQVYSDQGDKQKALEHYQKALQIEQQLHDEQGLAITLYNISKVYFDLGKIHQALASARQSYAIAKKLGYPDEIKNAAYMLSSIYETTRQPVKALKYYKEYSQMKDSLLSKKNKEAIIKKELQYEHEKQIAINEAKHLAELEKQKHQAEWEKYRQNIIISSISIILIIVLSFGIFIWNRYKIIQKQKRIIENQKRIVEEKNQDIIDSITYAQRIQKAILPNESQWHQLLPDSFILFMPKDIVSGDFYWLEQVEDDIYFAAADCTGHGVPGAMVSVICSNALSKALIEEGIRDTGKLLDHTRDIVIERFSKSSEEVKDGMDVSLCRYNPKQRTLQWSGAHNPLWILRNGEIIEYKADRQPIGNYVKKDPFTAHRISLLPKDRIYVFSDGFQDQFGGPKQKKFKSKSLQKLLIKTQHLSIDEQKNAILEAFEKWKGELMQIDDVTLLCVQV